MDGQTEGVRKAEQGEWEQSLFSSSTKKRIAAITNIVRSLEGNGMFVTLLLMSKPELT
jgi:hypothetical protein